MRKYDLTSKILVLLKAQGANPPGLKFAAARHAVATQANATPHPP
jgi:hypothetical protein